MNRLLTIAGDEWRYWLRSQLVLCSVGVFAVLLISTSMLTTLKISEQEHARQHYQTEAEETFRAQPDRHPHRMVHYGHYAFRTPAPLALLDPGLDAVTGQSIFLEGHRQNSAMFTDASASASLGGLSWLSPALTYQLFGAILFVLLGYGAIVREREASTLPTLLVQGVAGWQLMLGKFLALASLAVILLVPLFVVAWIAESFASSLILTAAYLAYFCIWAAGTLLISALLSKRALVLTTATASWLCLCLLIPSLAVDVVSRSAKFEGRIESDLALLKATRKLGNSHNTADPAFDQMRANLLAQYNVDRIEDLPVNFRGIVSRRSEEKYTAKLNEFALARMATETQQVKRYDLFGWISPMLAVASASRAIAGTDLEHHHRFLQEAEQLRYSFVQGLNEAHATKLNYTTDINRGVDEESSKRARISSDNWQLFDEFRFTPATLGVRVENAGPSLLMLTSWLAALICGLFLVGARLRP